MDKLSKGAKGMILFAILVGLVLFFTNGLEEGYGITNTDTKPDEYGNNVSLFNRLDNLLIIKSTQSITKGITNLKSASNPLDIVGSLATAAIGVLGTVASLATTAFEVIAIIMDYYAFPEILQYGIWALISVSIGFLLLAAYLRYDT